MILAAIVVTYHPDINQVKKNIASFADNVDSLMLWDNSEYVVDFSPIQQQYPNIILLHSGSNQGLPIAYNRALNIATEKGCTHLMTMDQDSFFEDFPEYQRQLKALRNPSVGIFSCPVNNNPTEAGYINTTVCQSGSVYTIKMLNAIDGFRNNLFIGMVDAEICLRAMEKGYKIYQTTGSNLIHHVGSGRVVKFLGHSIAVSDYSPLRHYYDSRNRILLWHEFPNDFTLGNKFKHLWSRVKVATKIALFEQDKAAKISAILSGTWNGLRNKTKAYQH
jgi:rhamnosyltransferase